MTTDAALFDSLKYRVVVGPDGTRKYFNNAGQLHCEEGPAIVYPYGRHEWYRNGLRHRDVGPAVERANGYKEWWHYGLLHRTGGPAIEYTTGNRRWFLNGDEYTAHDYRDALVKQGLQNDN